MSRRSQQLNNAFVAGGVYYPPNRGRAQPKVSPTLQAQPQPQPKVESPLQRTANNATSIPPPTTPIITPQKPIVIETIPAPNVPEPTAPLPTDAANVNETEENSDGKEFSSGAKFSFKKIFLNRKKSSLRQKEKKIRQNRQLRKALLPKNALMALNEVKGITISDFIINNNPNGGFTAVVTVNCNQYEGRGNTKMSAKNSACEKALRDYVIEKMAKKPRLPRHNSTLGLNGQSQTEDHNMDTSDNNDSNFGDIENESVGDGEEGDDVPMINLASFAIFKLFTEWENDGFIIPELHPASNPAKPGGEGDSSAPKEPKQAPTRNELPTNWEAMHPATLLCIMRPGLSYIDNGPIGEKPNIMQTVTVVTDGEQFHGQGRSKKIARRNAAVAVCNKLFGTNFTDQEA